MIADFPNVQRYVHDMRATVEDDAPVISVRDVSKRYIQSQQAPSLRHEAQRALRRLFRLGNDINDQAQSPFYALKNVSFDVYSGESLGIIGSNGSGKTTLLRLISGITYPTDGMINVRGRFTSLIALGAGFNVEMSGRKNIYLNASIYGVSPSEVDAIVDTIIEFSGLERFIDVPVKTYSSGMYARLAFSIAVHIWPDMIFLDEILSVGDQEFAQKCEIKIDELRSEKRTMLFVSHSMAAVKRMCERVLWLKNGEMMAIGPSEEVIEAYQKSITG